MSQPSQSQKPQEQAKRKKKQNSKQKDHKQIQITNLRSQVDDLQRKFKSLVQASEDAKKQSTEPSEPSPEGEKSKYKRLRKSLAESNGKVAEIDGRVDRHDDKITDLDRRTAEQSDQYLNIWKAHEKQQEELEKLSKKCETFEAALTEERKTRDKALIEERKIRDEALNRERKIRNEALDKTKEYAELIGEERVAHVRTLKEHQNLCNSLFKRHQDDVEKLEAVEETVHKATQILETRYETAKKDLDDRTTNFENWATEFAKTFDSLIVEKFEQFDKRTAERLETFVEESQKQLQEQNANYNAQDFEGTLQSLATKTRTFDKDIELFKTQVKSEAFDIVVLTRPKSPTLEEFARLESVETKIEHLRIQLTQLRAQPGQSLAILARIRRLEEHLEQQTSYTTRPEHVQDIRHQAERLEPQSDGQFTDLQTRLEKLEQRPSGNVEGYQHLAESITEMNCRILAAQQSYDKQQEDLANMKNRYDTRYEYLKTQYLSHLSLAASQDGPQEACKACLDLKPQLVEHKERLQRLASEISALTALSKQHDTSNAATAHNLFLEQHNILYDIAALATPMTKQSHHGTLERSTNWKSSPTVIMSDAGVARQSEKGACNDTLNTGEPSTIEDTCMPAPQQTRSGQDLEELNDSTTSEPSPAFSPITSNFADDLDGDYMPDEPRDLGSDLFDVEYPDEDQSDYEATEHISNHELDEMSLVHGDDPLYSCAKRVSQDRNRPSGKGIWTDEESAILRDAVLETMGDFNRPSCEERFKRVSKIFNDRLKLTTPRNWSGCRTRWRRIRKRGQWKIKGEVWDSRPGQGSESSKTCLANEDGVICGNSDRESAHQATSHPQQSIDGQKHGRRGPQNTMVWTKEESEMLLQLVQETVGRTPGFGHVSMKRFAEIAKIINDTLEPRYTRNEHGCKSHWLRATRASRYVPTSRSRTAESRNPTDASGHGYTLKATSRSHSRDVDHEERPHKRQRTTSDLTRTLANDELSAMDIEPNVQQNTISVTDHTEISVHDSGKTAPFLDGSHPSNDTLAAQEDISVHDQANTGSSAGLATTQPPDDQTVIATSGKIATENTPDQQQVDQTKVQLARAVEEPSAAPVFAPSTKLSAAAPFTAAVSSGDTQEAINSTSAPLPGWMSVNLFEQPAAESKHEQNHYIPRTDDMDFFANIADEVANEINEHCQEPSHSREPLDIAFWIADENDTSS